MLVLTLLGPLWAPFLQAEIMTVIACWCGGASGAKSQAVRIIGVEAVCPSIREVFHVPEMVFLPSGDYHSKQDLQDVAEALGNSTFERKVLSTVVMSCYPPLLQTAIHCNVSCPPATLGAPCAPWRSGPRFGQLCGLSGGVPPHPVSRITSVVV